MNAGEAGVFVGAFLASAGFGYIWLGILRLVRIYKRMPRTSYWSAVALTAFLGFSTAISASEAVYLVSTLAACGFMVWYGRRTLFPATAPPVT